MRLRCVALGLLALLILPVTQVAEAAANARIPAVHGTTFSNVKVDLPEALHGKVGILVVGFSQGSRDAVTEWGKKLASDYYDSSNVLYYEMPVLASVPKFMRGFVEGRIKASVSDRGKPHFLPVTDNEAQWRSLTHYSAPDDSYILVVDDQGAIRWQTQGAPTEAVYSLAKQQVELLTARNPQ